MNISYRDFCITQPSYPDVSESDIFYVKLANDIIENVKNTSLFSRMPEALTKKIVLTLTDYLQDVVSDGGLWRSFVIANRELYGYSVPFHEISDEYIDFELNKEDVFFLVWYVIAMLWEENRLIHPLDTKLIEFSEKCFEILELQYEEAPVPEHFNIARGLDFKDPEDRQKIFNLGNWLFLHSYLLTPAFSVTMRGLASDLNFDDPDFGTKLNKRLEESMMNDTTGPLALYTPEWVYLMLEGKLPPVSENKEVKNHKYYDAFVKYTGGKEIMFFDSYEKLNNFFINALGWEQNQEHLSQVKGKNDYILMVFREKGMLMAVNIARIIKAPDNPLYEKEYAKKHAFSLLTERGICPGDLLRVILKNNWLPDAHYPESEDYDFVNKYADFIARSFLQIYYRGD